MEGGPARSEGRSSISLPCFLKLCELQNCTSARQQPSCQAGLVCEHSGSRSWWGRRAPRLLAFPGVLPWGSSPAAPRVLLLVKTCYPSLTFPWSHSWFWGHFPHKLIWAEGNHCFRADFWVSPKLRQCLALPGDRGPGWRGAPP